MGFKFKRLKKSLKKTVKSVGKVAIKAVKYGAPIVGTVLGGPIGGAAGTALAGAAATHRAKNKGAAFMRTVKYGGSVALAGGLGNVAGGGGFFSSNVLGNVGNIFGGGSTKVNSGLDDAFIDPASSELESKSKTGTLEALARGFGLGAPDSTVSMPNDFPTGGKSSPEPDAVGGSLDGMFGSGSAGAGLGMGAGGEEGGLAQSPVLWIGLGLAALWLLS